ncbi:transcription factor WhiB [Streptomyces sp. 840.1]|nr:transcription factor WhiB [Streptomyces sp. 840.1]
MKPTTWHADAACRTAPDPEIFFAVGEYPAAQQQTADAKRICHACPVMDQCLSWALETRQDSGVWGGLDERERRRIHRRKTTGGATAHQPRTLASVLAERSVPATGGHTDWTGSSPITINGDCYTPAQLAWHVTHGKAPDGPVTVECGHPGCITPGHLLDAVGRRQRHGTPGAWQAHKRRGEEPCEECREARAAYARELRAPQDTAALASA